MVATNSLSLSGVISLLLHVTHSDNKFRRKNSRAREGHDGQISHIPRTAALQTERITLSSIHSNSQPQHEHL